MQDHPVDPETVANLAESRSEERLLHRHEHLASSGKHRKNAFGLTIALGIQSQVGASHWLRCRDVGACKLSASDSDAGMEDCVLRLAGRIRGAFGTLPVRHHHVDLGSEVLLIVTERLGALT